MLIHPTAVIDSKAEIGDDCEIGPGAIIEAGAILGPRCKIGPNAFVGRFTRMGEGNHLHIGAVVGHIPQDIRFNPNTVSYCEIGDFNTFREYSVIHRSARPEGATRIGSHNFVMNHGHIGHDGIIGDHAIIGAGAVLGGYVEVGDRAYISGNSAVHQFCRIGRIGMLRGVSGTSMDIPPFCIADWHNTLRGINKVGLVRAGFSAEARDALKGVFKTLFRSGDPMHDAIAVVHANAQWMAVPEVQELLAFVRTSKRGIVSWRHVDDTVTSNGTATNDDEF